MAEPGTFERIAMLMGEALSPLGERLQPDRALDTLGALGIALPPDTITPAFRTALGSAATAAGQLPELVGNLAASIEADAGGIEITGDAVLLAEKVAAIIDASVTIADTVSNLPPVPGLTAGELDAFAAALPGRLLELLLVDNIRVRIPTLAAVLELIGVISTETLNAGSTDPVKPEVKVSRLRFDRIGDLFSSPEDLFADLYGWGGGAFDAKALLERLGTLLIGVGLPVTWSTIPGPPPRQALEMLLLSVSGTAPAVNPPGLDALVTLAVGEGFNLPLALAPGLNFELRASGAVAAATGVRIQPPANLTLVPPTGSVQGEITAALAKVPAPGEEAVVLIGVVGGSRLQAASLSLGVKALFAWDAAAGAASGDIGFEGRISGGKLVISLEDADGFIDTLLSGFGLEADFDLGFGWTAGGGVFFTGSGGLEVQVPVHITLGPVEINGITLGIGIGAGAGGFVIPIELGATIKAALGPVQAVVENIGVAAELTFPDDQSGNLGVANLGFAFKPPNGVGLSIDAGVVKGGGYLFIDTDKGEYAGALELVIADFLSIGAIGLITTKNPDGSDGFSLLVLMSVDFGTGIQLGYGFTLIAVGGLVGLNRTMNLQALTEGVRSGALESVMFPTDIVANAPRILSDLRAFFPAQEGTFLVGPMVKLGWGTPTLISVAVGVIIEIPGNIAIVGILKVALPTEDAPLIQLQVNFVGAIEFDKSRLYFFASLFESRVLFMTIEGEMGLLVAWGDDANFVLSVGGFHPRFTPPPLPFPSPVRVSVNIIDTDYARIRVMGYFAVTSNTVQFGARAELFFGFSAFSVEGHVAFDALFQFSPFFFVIEISASVSLKAFGVGVFSIRLHFALEGPTPWRAHGTGSISLLFFEIEADFDITWGEHTDTIVEPVDVLPLLAAELAKDQAWSALLPPGVTGSVTPLALEATNDALLLHPVGTLRVQQRAVPLDLTFAKVGSQKARDVKRLTLDVLGPSLAERGNVDEQFALAQFLELDDAAKLSRAAYERQHGGIEIGTTGAGAGTGRMVKRTVRYEAVVIDDRFRRRRFRFQLLSGLLFDHFLQGAAITLSPLSTKQALLKDPHQSAIAVTADTFAVASAATNNVAGAGLVFTSEAAALDHLSSLVADDPNLAEELHVIPTVELAGA